MKFIKLILALACLQLVGSGYKLNSNVHHQTAKDFTKEVLLFENEKIKIISNFVDYKSPNRSVVKNYLLLSFTNKTNKKINVNFSREVYYDDKCSSCGTQESQFSVTLHKRETKSGSLEKNSSKALKVFHSFKTGESNRTLSDVRITQLIIKKA